MSQSNKKRQYRNLPSLLAIYAAFCLLVASISGALTYQAGAISTINTMPRNMAITYSTWPDGSVIVEEASPLKRDSDLTPWLIGGGLLLLVAAVSSYVWITKRKRK